MALYEHCFVHVQLTHDVKAGLPNAYVGLVFVTFCVGSYLFTLGCFLMTVPVINEASSHSVLCCIASYPAAKYFASQNASQEPQPCLVTAP